MIGALRFYLGSPLLLAIVTISSHHYRISPLLHLASIASNNYCAITKIVAHNC